MNGAELFERAARERPDDPALFYFDTAIGFREAAEPAHGLAVSLRDELGLRPGDRVALMLQNVPSSRSRCTRSGSAAASSPPSTR